MKSLFAQIRSARDILCNRLPAVLAMLNAEDVSIATIYQETKERGPQHALQVTYHFGSNGAAKTAAYQRIEYLYEMTRDQNPLDR